MWRGYAATCTGLRMVADIWGYMAFWQTLSHLVTLYRPTRQLATFPRGRGCKVLGLDDLLWCWPPRSLLDRILHGEPHLYWGEFIRCQNNYDDYACSCRGVCHVKRWWDGFQYSSACCQVCVGTCEYVFSCLALNDIIIQRPRLSSHARCLGYPRALLQGARTHAQPGRQGKFRLSCQVVKSYSLTVTETGKRNSANCSRV
jgi:hypothetical protein